MHRIDTSTAQKDKFGAGKNGFTLGNAQTGVPPTEVSADILDALQEEICTVIEEASQLDKKNNHQLLDAIKHIVSENASPDSSETQKGVSRFATADEVVKASSGGVAVQPKHLPAAIEKYAPVVGGYRALKLSSDGISANIVIAAEQLVLDAVSDIGTLLAKNISVTAVASASGLNGLDTGSLAASTWYSVWVISNGTTIASLLSLSTTAPKMPAGYTHRRRVGWIRTDASANKYPLAFIQAGKYVSYKIGSGTNLSSPRVCASGSTGSLASWTQASLTAFIPQTAISVNATIGGGCSNSSAAVAPNQSYPGVNAAPVSSPILEISQATVAGTTHLVSTGDIMLESISIYYQSTVTTMHIQINGWSDML